MRAVGILPLAQAQALKQWFLGRYAGSNPQVLKSGEK